MKKLSAFLLICLLPLGALVPIFALDKSVVLGGENGWSEIAYSDGLTIESGRFGLDSLQIVTSSPELDENTDLLISFEDNSVTDAAKKYEIVSSAAIPVSAAVKGKGATLFTRKSGGIELEGHKDSIFGTSGIKGSFMIEFWISPSAVESGEVVFLWRSSLNANRYSNYQMILAGFESNKLVWRFIDIFPDYSELEFTLSGVSSVIPGKWSCHILSFDARNGLLEYIVNGKTEAVRFITDSGHEDGSVCLPALGLISDIFICPEYTGLLDSFMIRKTAYDKEREGVYVFENETYKSEGGRFVSNPIRVSQAASLTQIIADTFVPEQTEIRFYARGGDNFYNWTETSPEWKEVLSGEKITGVSGLYFQVMAELLSDGGGKQTPNLSRIELHYEEQSLPLPPFSVFAEAGDSSVTVSWNYSLDDNADGYFVYYGNKSGEYLGRAAIEGFSPVKVGNKTSLTLTGLQNGKIYYFAVASYSKADNRILGELSKEVYARPSARFAKNTAAAEQTIRFEQAEQIPSAEQPD